MPRYQCVCGSKYKFPDSASGKRAKCKHCGVVFTLPEESNAPIPIAEEPAPAWDRESEIAAATFRAREAAVAAPAIASPPLIPASRLRNDTFSHSILWTVLFPASIQNLLMFIGIWVGLTVGAMMPCLVPLLVSLWYAAFRFAVIESGAAGDKGLPEVEFSRSALFDALGDAFRWLASWAVALLPAILYFVAQAASGTGLDARDAMALAGGLSAFWPGSGADPVLLMLVAVGLFFWPIIVLVITLGGFECLYRFDLIVLTVMRSFPGYVVTVVLVFGATALEQVLRSTVLSGMGPGLSGGIGMAVGTAIAAHALFVGISLYCNIVMLRSIGLYYHHFKEQFAWDWG